MNPVDLAVCLVCLMAAWSGWRRGLVVQICSLVGIAAGLWFASRHAGQAGEWLGLDGALVVPGGFAALFVAVLLAVGIAGRLLGGLFRLVGFGLPDRLLGAAVSVAKFALVLSVLFAACEPLLRRNERAHEALVGSVSYRPLCDAAEALLPLLEQARAEWQGMNAGNGPREADEA